MKIALVYNIRITDLSLSGVSIDKDPDNFDIFLLSLSSLKNISFHHIYLFLDIDKKFHKKLILLNKLLNTHFKKKFTIILKRIKLLSDHKKFSLQLQKKKFDYIMYHGAHDHVYIAPNDFDLLNFLNSSSHLNFDSLFLSHYPELLSRKFLFPHLNNPSFILKRYKQGTVISWRNFDTAQIFTVNIFCKFWHSQKFEGEINDPGWFRTDDPRFPEKINNINVKTLIPNIELMRHFDGYDHAKIYGYKLDRLFYDQFMNKVKLSKTFLMKYKLYDLLNIKHSELLYLNDNPRFCSFRNFSFMRLIKVFNAFLSDLKNFVRIFIKRFLFKLINK